MAHAPEVDDGGAPLQALLRDAAQRHGMLDPLVRVRPVDSDGANFTSRLYLVSLSTDHRHLHLFAKVGCFSDAIRAEMHADRLFCTEHLVYTKLAKTWEDLQEKHRVPADERYLFPGFYGADLEPGSETVVLEDLASAGYGGVDRLEPLSWEHAAAAADTLARLHALSFALGQEAPEEFGEMVERLRYRSMTRGAAPDALWARVVQPALQTLQGAARERAARFCEAAPRQASSAYMAFHEPRGTPVLAHGDFRPSNLMFRTEGGSVRCIVLDYQTVYAGCPAADVLYLEVVGTDAGFRRRHHAALLARYHAALARALARYGIRVDHVYPRRQFDADVKELLPLTLLLGVTVLPMATAAAGLAPRPEAAGLASFLPRPGALFQRRFQELVEDLMRWEAI